MKTIKSTGIFDIKDFPINFVRTGILKGTGADIEELGEKPLIAVVNSYSELNPGHIHLRAMAERIKGVWTTRQAVEPVSCYSKY